VVTEKKIINKAGDLMIEPTHQQTASGARRQVLKFYVARETYHTSHLLSLPSP
jgi:hypothetical protein